MKKSIIQCFFLNLFEFYELGIYGIFIFSMISLFFHDHNPFLSTIMNLSILSLSFGLRLFGSILFCSAEDNKIRAEVLSLNAFMMGVVSLLIGCLPTYAHMNILAPIFLLIFRIIQGICIRRKDSRMVILSLRSPSIETRRKLESLLSPAGILSFLIALCLPEMIVYFYSDITWIWRAPFWIGGLIGGIGVCIRISFLKNKVLSL